MGGEALGNSLFIHLYVDSGRGLYSVGHLFVEYVYHDIGHIRPR